eukprot:31312-Pelagococcus_subviridis.AAC.21
MFRLFIILSRKPFFGSGGGGGGGAAASSAAISATAATPPSTAIGVRDRGSSNDTLTLASDTLVRALPPSLPIGDNVPPASAIPAPILIRSAESSEYLPCSLAPLPATTGASNIALLPPPPPPLADLPAATEMDGSLSRRPNRRASPANAPPPPPPPPLLGDRDPRDPRSPFSAPFSRPRALAAIVAADATDANDTFPGVMIECHSSASAIVSCAVHRSGRVTHERGEERKSRKSSRRSASCVDNIACRAPSICATSATFIPSSAMRCPASPVMCGRFEASRERRRTTFSETLPRRPKNWSSLPLTHSVGMSRRQRLPNTPVAAFASLFLWLAVVVVVAPPPPPSFSLHRADRPPCDETSSSVAVVARLARESPAALAALASSSPSPPPPPPESSKSPRDDPPPAIPASDRELGVPGNDRSDSPVRTRFSVW